MTGSDTHAELETLRREQEEWRRRLEAAERELRVIQQQPKGPQRRASRRRGIPSPTEFFRGLVWLDGRPLLNVIEPYRLAIFEEALYTFDEDGNPAFNRALTGRGKKNWKSADLILAAFYRLFAWQSPAGNDVFLLANDEGQAHDDLKLAKKLVWANPALSREVEVRAKIIDRVDGRGSLEILPAKDVIGQHGKTYLFVGYDEIHGYRNFDLLEALAPDPSRPDAMEWFTSYASIYNAPGAPLRDLFETGKKAADPRMFFSWYSSTYTTDPAFEDAQPWRRANPSEIVTEVYIAQQQERLPTHKYRRLHLNEPGLPEGAALDAVRVMDCVVEGRRSLPYTPGRTYHAFVDMSGGSADDACLAIAHRHDDGRAVLDLVVSQTGKPPFDPRAAVAKFAGVLGEYRLNRVCGDRYAGETFRRDFAELGIVYTPSSMSKHELYAELEPRLNAGDIELLDQSKLIEQLLGLVWRGKRIDHSAGEHDDYSNAAAGALALITRPRRRIGTFGDDDAARYSDEWRRCVVRDAEGEHREALVRNFRTENGAFRREVRYRRSNLVEIQTCSGRVVRHYYRDESPPSRAQRFRVSAL